MGRRRETILIKVYNRPQFFSAEGQQTSAESPHTFPERQRTSAESPQTFAEGRQTFAESPRTLAEEAPENNLLDLPARSHPHPGVGLVRRQGIIYN